jgi:hypothetical protein
MFNLAAGLLLAARELFHNVVIILQGDPEAGRGAALFHFLV